MFQALSNELFDLSEVEGTGAKTPGIIFCLHPAQLQAYLDALWETWRVTGLTRLNDPIKTTTATVFGMPAVKQIPNTVSFFNVSVDTRLAAELEVLDFDTRIPIFEAVNNVLKRLQPTSFRQPYWHHLIYAYLIENTRILEIGARLVKEAVYGEKLRITNPESLAWLRNTEELFFRETSPYYIGSVTSRIRPDSRGVRCNAYFRMFGMDLNHGTEDNQPYPYVKAEAANHDFVRLWRDFLREVWRGFVNRDNETGANTTDDEAITELAEKLGQLLLDRRGIDRRILAREEFAAVATLSWFHLTVANDSSIVEDLKANATTPEERTRRLGEIVGLPSNARSRSFFKMAEPMSRILHALEQRNFTQGGDFYETDGAHTKNMVTLITHWSIATGDDVKSIPVTGSR